MSVAEVPATASPSPTACDADALVALVTAGPGLVVLTGAGMSTDSGIPDYRGPGALPRNPMTFQDFVATPAAQQRYWARAFLGWRFMGGAEPNDGHRALAQLERDGHVSLLITQNVDTLHRVAGSERLVELHGRVDEVVCLDCRTVTPRREVHDRLAAANPGFTAADVQAAPDGDVDLDDTAGFVVVGCRVCDGRLKPNVVFFGESVDKPVVQRCFDAVDQARAVLVLGSSLTVHSGLRFVRRAHKRGIPVAVVNRGTTRADDLASVRIDAGCTETLKDLVAALR
jgi:NAD-dependent SIR2 family protein deacetylase